MLTTVAVAVTGTVPLAAMMFALRTALGFSLSCSLCQSLRARHARSAVSPTLNAAFPPPPDETWAAILPRVGGIDVVAVVGVEEEEEVVVVLWALVVVKAGGQFGRV